MMLRSCKTTQRIVMSCDFPSFLFTISLGMMWPVLNNSHAFILTWWLLKQKTIIVTAKRLNYGKLYSIECTVFVTIEINFDSTSETLISFSSFAELRRWSDTTSTSSVPFCSPSLDPPFDRAVETRVLTAKSSSRFRCEWLRMRAGIPPQFSMRSSINHWRWQCTPLLTVKPQLDRTLPNQ